MPSHGRLSTYETTDSQHSSRSSNRSKRLVQPKKASARGYYESYTQQRTPKKRRTKQQATSLSFDMMTRAAMSPGNSDEVTGAAAASALLCSDQNNQCDNDNTLSPPSNEDSGGMESAGTIPPHSTPVTVSKQIHKRQREYQKWNSLVPFLARAIVSWRSRREGEPPFTTTSLPGLPTCTGLQCSDSIRFFSVKLVSLNRMYILVQIEL
jgi:hypothetical protein